MPRLVLMLLCLPAAALLISACGGSSKEPSRASAADRALAFSRCMREHGVKNFPDPQVSGGAIKLQFKTGAGANPQTIDKAQQACRHLVAAGEKKLTPQERVEREEQVTRFARCMREHGVNIHASSAKGDFSIQVRPGGAGGGPNPESPVFRAAQKACQGLMPGPKGGPGGGPQTSNSGGGGGGAGLSFGYGG